MISALQKKEDKTIELTITIPANEVKKTWEQVVEEMVKKVQLPGFRKGKAPKKLVADKLDIEKIREEVLKILLPKYYIDAVKEHSLKPIMNPKIHVAAVSDPKEDKDWQFIALTCEAPEVQLNDYKKKIQDITAKSKIIIPGKEPFDQAQGKKTEIKMDDVMQALLGSVTIAIPKILSDQEADRLLAQMLDDVKKLGLTLDQYLSSTGRTPESLRTEYEKKVEQDMKLEFALQKIAEEEKITVEDKEIEEAIQKAKTEEEKKHLEANRYLLSSILRQQKTLDFIKNL